MLSMKGKLMFKNIYRFGQNTVKYITLLIVSYLFLGSVLTHIYDSKYIEAYVKTHNIFYNILGIVLFCLLFYGLWRLSINRRFPINNKKWKNICLFLICIQIIFFMLSNPIPGSDQLNILFAIIDLNGYSSAMPIQDPYWRIAPHVFANVMYQSVFGIVYTIFYAYNAVLYIIMYELWMRMTKNSKTTAILFVLAVPITSYIFMYYGEITALFGITASIYIIRKFFNGEIRWYHYLVLAGITFLTYWEKNNFVIFIIAEILTIILFTFQYKKKALQSLLIAAVIVVGSISVKPITHELAKNVFEFDMGEYSSISYIAMGMHEISQNPKYDYNTQIEGGFDGSNHLVVFENNYDLEKVEMICREDIKNRLKEFSDNPMTALKFYNNKSLKQWTTPDWSTNWLIKLSKIENIKKIVEYKEANNTFYTDGLDYEQFKTPVDGFQDLFSKGMLICVYFFACYFILKNRKENLTPTDCILLALFIGNFIFSLIWEAKPRYCIYGYFALMMYVAIHLARNNKLTIDVL